MLIIWFCHQLQLQFVVRIFYFKFVRAPPTQSHCILQLLRKLSVYCSVGFQCFMPRRNVSLNKRYNWPNSAGFRILLRVRIYGCLSIRELYFSSTRKTYILQNSCFQFSIDQFCVYFFFCALEVIFKLCYLLRDSSQLHIIIFFFFHHIFFSRIKTMSLHLFVERLNYFHYCYPKYRVSATTY